MTTSSPLSNSRKCRCIDCAAVIAPHKGHVVATSQYICDGCKRVRQAQTDAWNYSRQVLARVNNPDDRWLVNSMLTHLVLRTGEKSPMILQAVADRVGWLDAATYSLVCDIARQEARAIGLDVQVL